MSIRQNSLSRIFSLNTLVKNNSKNSKLQYFSANNYNRPSRSRLNSNKKIFMQGIENFPSYKIKTNKNNRKNQISFTNRLNTKNSVSSKQRFYNPDTKIDSKEIINNVKQQFISRYNGIFYDDTISLFYNNNNDQYSFYDYYTINDLINNKRFHLSALLKEYNIYYKQQEILIRYYGKKERYIIMKYLLSFVYKYDELCYDINKEITDLKTKEELVKTFHYITSNQYLYEHLLDTDSLKGIKFLLKRVNLTNKKAQYDYSYLEMTKNKVLSEENKYIINAIKVVNEFMNNIKFLEKKLIKNYPLEKVPNCIPNYYALGFELNLCLKNYINLKKSKKILQPTDETKNLINNFQEKYSNSAINNKNNPKDILFRQKKDYFSIDEKITEIESSLDDNENNSIIKKQKNSSNIHTPNNNFNYLLPLSLYEHSEKEKIKKKYSFIKKKTRENITGYNKYYNISKPKNIGKRIARDPDIDDIENFLYLFPKDKNKVSKNTSYYKRKSVYKIDDKYNNKKENLLNTDNKPNTIKSNFDKINKDTKFKVKDISLKFENDFRKNKKTNIIVNSPNNKKNEKIKQLNLFKNKDSYLKINQLNLSQNQNNILSSFGSNSRAISSKLTDRKINKKIKNNNFILLSNNNISSTIFSDGQNLTRNMSYSRFINNKNIIFSKNNNLLNINFNNSSNSLYNNINSNQKINNKNKKNQNKNDNNIFTFKDTNDFINGLKYHYSKIKVKPNFLLKNLSSYKDIHKSKEFSNDSSKTKTFLSNNNTPSKYKKKQNNFFYEGSISSIKNISNYVKKQIDKSKQKDNKNITFKQIIKNSDFYSSNI